MSDEILKDLNRVIEKYKDKVFCTGELNYVDMAKSCKLEIERLNNIIKDIKSQLEYIETYSSKEDVFEDMKRRLDRIESIVNRK